MNLSRNLIALLILFASCQKDPVPLEKKEGVIIDIGNDKTYAWSDLTYGNMAWIGRINANENASNGYYYFFDGEDVVIQALEKPSKVLYFETAKAKGVPLTLNGKNAVRQKLGEYGSFNFHYPFE